MRPDPLYKLLPNSAFIVNKASILSDECLIDKAKGILLRAKLHSFQLIEIKNVSGKVVQKHKVYVLSDWYLRKGPSTCSLSFPEKVFVMTMSNAELAEEPIHQSPLS